MKKRCLCFQHQMLFVDRLPSSVFVEFNDTTREHPFVKVKILVPSDGQIKETIEELRVEYPQVDFRIYEQGLNSRITIVLVDKRECMIIEVKDDTKDHALLR